MKMNGHFVEFSIVLYNILNFGFNGFCYITNNIKKSNLKFLSHAILMIENQIFVTRLEFFSVLCYYKFGNVMAQ